MRLFIRIGLLNLIRNGEPTTTEDTVTFLDRMQRLDGGYFLRDLAGAVLQKLMDQDVDNLIGAARCEGSDERATQRNVFRERAFETRLGAFDFKIPNLRKGSYFPGFLKPRGTGERAFVAVIREDWIQGVSTRWDGDLVQAMGMSGISKSQVSALCKDIDSRVNSFLDRPLEGEWHYIWVDANYLQI